MPRHDPITSISAVTLLVAEMARAVDFYESLGFTIEHGGRSADFTTLAAGGQFLNLQPGEPPPGDPIWGRVIFHVDDVDEVHRTAVAAGHRPEASPRNAPWGERYFHLRDPDGHELSFARPL